MIIILFVIKKQFIYEQCTYVHAKFSHFCPENQEKPHDIVSLTASLWHIVSIVIQIYDLLVNVKW